jgi:hypothetical protein
LGRREIVPREGAFRLREKIVTESGAVEALGRRIEVLRRPAFRFWIYLGDDACSAIEEIEEECRTEQRARNGDEKGQKFLTRFSDLGEEGHVQLRFFRGL